MLALIQCSCAGRRAGGSGRGLASGNLGHRTAVPLKSASRACLAHFSLQTRAAFLRLSFSSKTQTRPATLTPFVLPIPGQPTDHQHLSYGLLAHPFASATSTILCIYPSNCVPSHFIFQLVYVLECDTYLTRSRMLQSHEVWRT
jgi:hypothetical protein